MILRMRLPGVSLAAIALSLGLTGCGLGVSPSAPGITGTMHLTGQVHGGQQPVTASQVYLYAVSATNGGTAASLLNTPGFVPTDTSGSFSITSDYTCPAGAYVYLLAIGGNPGLSLGVNSEIALAAGLGPCSSLSASTHITINELTTVAFAYAVAGFATSDTQIGTTSSLAAPFAYVNTVLSQPSGLALPSTSSYTLPQAALNSLADSIAACINSSGVGAPCSTLMTAANASPMNTFQAALNIAQKPGANVSTIYSLGAADAVFQPTLPSAPTSWSLPVTAANGNVVADANTYSFNTTLGNICVQFRPDAAPLTVANFRYYINNGSFANMFIHRSQPGFVIQGGGYAYNSSGNVTVIPTQAPVTNEFNLSNVRGTIAMALVSDQPNTATDQFFFNDVNNSAILDPESYTVFGSIVGVAGYTSGGCASASAGLAVMDAINALPTVDEGVGLEQLPLVNYTSGGTVTGANLVFSPITGANPQ
jgi:cyclophilin family peptidyl-prolyl cis-trans isomerase